MKAIFFSQKVQEFTYGDHYLNASYSLPICLP